MASQAMRQERDRLQPFTKATENGTSSGLPQLHEENSKKSNGGKSPQKSLTVYNIAAWNQGQVVAKAHRAL